MVQLNLRLPDDLAAMVDKARGDVPRNRWLVRAVEAQLGRELGLEGPQLSDPPPAPAEQPVRRVSPSGPASPRVPFRRDVKPFQRGS